MDERVRVFADVLTKRRGCIMRHGSKVAHLHLGDHASTYHIGPSNAWILGLMSHAALQSCTSAPLVFVGAHRHGTGPDAALRNRSAAFMQRLRQVLGTCGVRVDWRLGFAKQAGRAAIGSVDADLCYAASAARLVPSFGAYSWLLLRLHAGLELGFDRPVRGITRTFAALGATPRTAARRARLSSSVVPSLHRPRPACKGPRRHPPLAQVVCPHRGRCKTVASATRGELMQWQRARTARLTTGECADCGAPTHVACVHRVQRCLLPAENVTTCKQWRSHDGAECAGRASSASGPECLRCRVHTWASDGSLTEGPEGRAASLERDATRTSPHVIASGIRPIIDHWSVAGLGVTVAGAFFVLGYRLGYYWSTHSE